jgi:ligand-binding sensor domain-containing protein/signal transduction histidine kinase
MRPNLPLTGRLSFVLGCVFATAVLPAATAWAIAPDRSLAACNVEVWRSRDGLPGAWIRTMTQTADGYLWIGTQAGLARYGGGAMVPIDSDRIFEHAEPFEHVSEVTGLLAARDGTIWLTPARGMPVCVRGDSFRPCLPEMPAAVRYASRIVDVSQDSAGVIWIATGDQVFRRVDGQLTPIAADPSWQGARLTAIAHDLHDNLWLGTSRGLFVQGKTGVKRITEAAVAAIFVGRRGQIWVAAEHQLAHVDGDEIAIITARDGLPEARFTKILEDHDGNVWIGAREGLIRYQPRAAQARRFVRFTPADGLPDEDVSALFEDREGSLWVGTRAGGLAQFTDRTLDLQSGPASVREHWVSSVTEDQDGALWLGTGLGLTRWHNGEERTFTSADGLPSTDVLSVIPGRPGELWVGTTKGLARFSAGRAEIIAGLTGAVSALNLDRATQDVWIGGAEGVVARLHDGRLERFTPHPELGNVALGLIRGIERDDQGTVWVSANGKLLRIEGQQLRRDPAPEAVALAKVRALARDEDGTLWLGTGVGLVRRRQGRWRTFSRADGLDRSDLFQVVPDGRGSLWVGGIHGVIRITTASLDEIEQGRRRAPDVVSFDILDQRREGRATRTRQPGAWRARNGLLWFATSRGVVSIDPARLHIKQPPPPVLIERALVDGHPARRGADNRFPPGSGAFEFHFAAITLLEPQKAQHRYRLEGFDRDWVDAGSRRSAYYTRMNPGHYRFRVQGSNADGIWNETGDVIELTLAPHFYQAGWFYGLMGLAALGIALTFHRLRLDQVRARYVATAAERARMARELHDSLLQGMAGALMHLRGLRKRFSPDAAAASANTIAGEIKEIEELVSTNIEETRSMLSDLRNDPAGTVPPQGDAGEEVDLAVALGDLVGRVAPPAARKRAPATWATDVQMVVQGTPPRVPRHVQRELLRIAHEALTNALKHAGARHVEIRLSHEPAGLELLVRDDGHGFEPHRVAGVRNGHFGLTGMRERAAMLGQFQLVSHPGRGTRVSVTVNMKDLRDA